MRVELLSASETRSTNASPMRAARGAEDGDAFDETTWL
jgi:hypothetical protein